MVDSLFTKNNTLELTVFLLCARICTRELVEAFLRTKALLLMMNQVSGCFRHRELTMHGFFYWLFVSIRIFLTSGVHSQTVQ